ncbi:hypothetical protein ABIA30_003956 [Mycobacterium sp. MAA66]|uniref:hypothetical protein n=1 Tax=Mycobacterium sp. MAA66 TaxID=3156297 RepID=UPI003513E769
MKLVADSGLWSVGTAVAAPPAVALVELAGAVLEWTVDESSSAARITFTDVAAADWLWRLVGSGGHSTLVGSIGTTVAQDGLILDIADVVVAPEPIAALRRLALGHWLRRWWPTSRLDGIAALDPALLDAEIAVLTAALQEYFSEETFDSDIAGLLAPHRAALADVVRAGDPRAIELVRAAVDLADDAGLGDWSEILERQDDSAERRRDDYALAAGGLVATGGDVIAHGASTVSWTAVPPGVFDAAEGTVSWSVRWSGTTAQAHVRVATVGSAHGVPVRFESGVIGGRGVLHADGSATLQLVDADGQPIGENQVWAHHWANTLVSVGADVSEAASARESIRALARSRLSTPGPDSFLAEILAGEADY